MSIISGNNNNYISTGNNSSILISLSTSQSTNNTPLVSSIDGFIKFLADTFEALTGVNPIPVNERK